GGVGAEEAGPAAALLRVLAEPDHGEGQQADQDRDDEEVLQEAQPGVGTDERDVEVPVEQRAEALDDGGAEDEEAPEHGGVRGARAGPLQELALAEDLGGHRPQAGPRL